MEQILINLIAGALALAKKDVSARLVACKGRAS